MNKIIHTRGKIVTAKTYSRREELDNNEHLKPNLKEQIKDELEKAIERTTNTVKRKQTEYY